VGLAAGGVDALRGAFVWSGLVGWVWQFDGFREVGWVFRDHFLGLLS
jgi:hypothetical protein